MMDIQKRQELIARCEDRLKLLAGIKVSLAEEQREIYSIALAALNENWQERAEKAEAQLVKQEPVAWLIEFEEALTDDYSRKRQILTLEKPEGLYLDCATPLFTRAAPPAPVKLPEPVYSEDDEPWLYRDELSKQ